MYFVQHIDNATERIWSWPEGSTSPTSKDVGVDGWNNVVATATCSDGTNWLGYSLNVVQAAWVANGQIGAMWNSAEGGSFSYPQVRWVRFSTTDLSVVDQGNIHSNAVAWAFPSVSVNDRGDVAGQLALAVEEERVLPGWRPGYQIQPITISFSHWKHRHFRRHQWPGIPALGRLLHHPPGFALQQYLDGHRCRHARRHRQRPCRGAPVLVGRTSDTPPANASIYANVANSTTYQDGTSAHPYSSAADGNYACSAGDNLYIHCRDIP